jgi:hypothetical protein
MEAKLLQQQQFLLKSIQYVSFTAIPLFVWNLISLLNGEDTLIKLGIALSIFSLLQLSYFLIKNKKLENFGKNLILILVIFFLLCHSKHKWLLS